MALIKVKKNGSVFSIKENDKQYYLNQGWSVIDSKGKIVESNKSKEQKQIGKLKAENAKLKAELEKLKNQ